MVADMPCSEETFDAGTSMECFENALQESAVRPQALGPMLKLLLGKDFGQETMANFMNLTTLHLFIIINGLCISKYSLILDITLTLHSAAYHHMDESHKRLRPNT